MKKALLVVAVPLIAAAVWVAKHRSEPPEVPFAKVRRETLISTLPTNGKVEPLEWRPVRAELSGLIDRVDVKEGQQVAQGASIAALRKSEAASELARAEAQMARAKADLAAIERGGRSSELAEIDNALARAKFDRDTAEREQAALARLAEKRAATPAEVETARRKVRQAEIEIESLERKRAALVSATERGVVEARIREAQAAADAARKRLAQAEIRAPIAGAIYNLAVRASAWLNPGDPVANVGRLDRLRVRVYVDEPELGRVAVGQPVEITWDALPGQRWSGAVEKLPSEIVTLGTRQVGVVQCTIENAHGRLTPGANVNAEIRTSVVENALTIPKEALRREGGQAGVYVLRGDRVAWQAVTAGASSATRSHIAAGLSDGDAVALPTERALRGGATVKPVFP